MPYVLIHKQERLIYSCTLLNNYQIPFYGTKFWEDQQEAEDQFKEFLEEQQVTDPESWELFEVEEHKLKIFNVKLSNNPMRKVRMEEDGRTVVC